MNQSFRKGQGTSGIHYTGKRGQMTGIRVPYAHTYDAHTSAALFPFNSERLC